MVLAGLAGVTGPHAPVGAARSWAPAGEATVHPGVQTYTAGGGQCTANFVFVDATDVYLGVAAHCAGTGGSFDSDGCEAGSLPLGTEIEVEGASQPGTLAYSSWLAMQMAGEAESDVCRHNDFALVRLDPADHARVNPSVPFWGGPVAPTADSVRGEPVYSYGNSSLRFGAEPLKPKEGVALGEEAGGWNHPVYTATPGVPGDSGSAFLDEQGGALGVLVTLQVAPMAGSNGVTDLGLALDYLLRHGGPAVSVAHGTEPFSPGSLR